MMQPTEIIDKTSLVEWTRRFVRRASPQTERFEAEPQVQGLIDDVEQLVVQLGLPHRRDGMGNLIVELGRASRRSAVLMTYAMTHPAGAMRDPYEGEIVEKDGMPAIRGRGVSEQKGPLAAALAASLAAHHNGQLGGSLSLIVSSAGETGRHDAARVAVSELQSPPTAAIIAAGTTGKLSLGNKGRLDVLITVRGRAAHSSTPWRGIDAVAGAAEVVRRLGGLELGGSEHARLGKATLVPTSIRSFPDATHTLQAEVRMVFDRRLLPGDSPDVALRQIQASLKGMQPWSIEVQPGALMHPSEVNPEGDVVTAIDAGHRKMGLAPPDRFYSHGSLDAGFFTSQGIEACMWGPGAMEQWHSDDEYVPVAELYAGALGYYAFICEYLGREGA